VVRSFLTFSLLGGVGSGGRKVLMMFSLTTIPVLSHVGTRSRKRRRRKILRRELRKRHHRTAKRGNKNENSTTLSPVGDQNLVEVARR